MTIEQAQKIIADLTIKHGAGDKYAPIIRWDEFEKIAASLEAAVKHIEKLEARTVTLPTPYPKGYGLAADKYNFALEECADAIRAAGIAIEGA